MDIYTLAQQCSPHIQEREVVAAIAHTESKFNPYAIGVVGGSVRQPTNSRDAILTVRALRKAGKDFSVGIAQVNQSNFSRYGLTESTMFEPCSNLKAGMSIYKQCFDKANLKFGSQYSYDGKLRLAASCYYSGNFTTGFKADFVGQPPYVTKFYNKLLEYRANSKRQVVQQPVVVKKVQTVATPTQDISKDSEYSSILNAIKAQNNESKETVNETDNSKIVDKNKDLNKNQKFSGDVFAVTQNDIFSSKQI